MDSFCVTVALFTCVYVWKPQLTLSSLFLRSNLYGKQPADYAVSQEMREIFQHGDGMATPHSPSVNLSVVCLHIGVLIVLCLFVFECLMLFLRWAGLWGGKNWCSWPPGCCSQSSSNWSDWGSCWGEEWSTPFLPQVGLSVSVIFQMCPSWDSRHQSLWLPQTRKSRVTTAASQLRAAVTDPLVQCQTLQ